MAEYGTSVSARLAKPIAMGLSGLAAAAALMTIGVGTASADDISADPSTPGNGREADGAVRSPDVANGSSGVMAQGEVRTSGFGEALASQGGEVRTSSRGVPGTKAWVFSGAAGDISACVYDGPWCANWMAIPFDINNP
ncbi:hypothetical protein EUA04_22495 [Mycolicibacterium obuense]|uniref:Secreted protein n=1 Tax=Mycolicibacterium obuense TaxID=1807 RepID=A0A4R5X243_9MYCO|nr:hypothetical protein EUA04_22495 [Mycolicibacterium obuense]